MAVSHHHHHHLSPLRLHFIILLLTLSQNPSSSIDLVSASPVDFSIIGSDWDLFQQDYSPPAPPPPPPHPPSVSCEDDLGGIGSLDTTCQIVSDLNLTRNVYIQGKGNFYILPHRSVNCLVSGCEINVNVTGNFSLGENSTIVAGTFELAAYNASFGDGSSVNTTGMGGSPPAQTSGTPQGVDGAGGGHGEEGLRPWSYGSRGGTTSKEVEYGGGGGGKVKLLIDSFLEVNGSLLADGGDGGSRGGGGSGGSIFIKAHKMIGSGRISACGGHGFGGGVVEESLLTFSAGMMILKSLFMVRISAFRF
ncbi:hypothetical protein Acr_20g0003050 [Actinidia rufa]|uniref:Glycine-rich protein n=1 Tax=Actinidia rufa TaxID=165716 RepID=A0A7J0GCH8_9ERIC|nr:hypothetical protein Acr_20g0003050 [Actinidia rufa]